MRVMAKAVIAAAAVAGTALVGMKTDALPVLKGAALAGRQADNLYLVVSNQLLRPSGETFAIKGRPVDLAFDSGERLLAILNSGSVLLRDGTTGAPIAEIKTKTTSYAGICFRPGDRELWVSETTRQGTDSLAILRLSQDGKYDQIKRIDLKGHPVPAGITFSPDGGKAYVALSRNNTLAVIDAESRRIEREIPVGLAPHAVLFERERGLLFVSNRAGRPPVPGQSEGSSGGSTVAVDPQTGATLSGTVSVIDSKTFATRHVDAGRSPSNLTLSRDGRTVVVANSHSDSLTFLDVETLQRVDVPVPTKPEGLIGSQPVATAFSPDGKLLYVACAGDNAITVLSKNNGRWQDAGAAPTAWFPSALLIDKQGDLRVASVKGTGNTMGPDGTHNSRQFEGQLAKITAPTPARLSAGREMVEAANRPRFTPAGGVENLASLGIQHVVLIVKENRTYDQVFSDMDKGNRDPKLLMYGREITPNHHALAEQYVLLDNFYATGAISFEGHQWLLQGFVSDYVERALLSSPRGYAWNLNDSLTVSPAGFFWQGARRNLDVRLFGATSLPRRWDPKTQDPVDITEDELLTWSEYWRMYKAGTWRSAVGARSGVPVLEPLMAPHYPASSMHIPDQIRADAFLEELARWEERKKAPHLSILTMTSDHTMGTRPGSPTPAAMVADNDLALGRIVEGLSKSSFWKNMLVLVVEDDAQNGVDHVDGHRTIALAVGPHVRRKALDSNFYTHLNMVRTIQDVFRIPPRTRFLAKARPMTSLFMAEPRLTAYKALTPDIALDTMNPPLTALRGRQLWAARRSLEMEWNEVDDVPTEVLNRILWWDRKGYETPYPAFSWTKAPGARHSD
jgi:YVTN family beta-propeller protein